MSAMREELHRLVDQLPEDEFQPALELIRGRVTDDGGQGRDLPFFTSFEAEPDLSRVTAQPSEDPADPLVILRRLPERERDEFLREYHQAVNAAHDPAGYQQLRRLLHVWSLIVIAAEQPGYYEELAAARSGTVASVPVTDAILNWAERVAAARARR
jgi:hypothetical protein